MRGMQIFLRPTVIAGDTLQNDYCVIHDAAASAGSGLPRRARGSVVWIWNVPTWCNGSASRRRHRQRRHDPKIATGEIEDIATEDGKNAAAVALGRMGGKAGEVFGQGAAALLNCSTDALSDLKICSDCSLLALRGGLVNYASG